MLYRFDKIGHPLFPRLSAALFYLTFIFILLGGFVWAFFEAVIELYRLRRDHDSGIGRVRDWLA